MNETKEHEQLLLDLLLLQHDYEKIHGQNVNIQERLEKCKEKISKLKKDHISSAKRSAELIKILNQLD